MADKKKDLANLLGGETPKSEIRRGSPLRLSTETSAAEAQDREIASSQKRIIAETAEAQDREIASSQKHIIAGTQEKPKRVNRGYMLREDLIKACKIAAVQEGRNLYEVMEQALEEYLERRRES